MTKNREKEHRCQEGLAPAMSGKHRLRLTDPRQITVYDFAAYHGPRRRSWWMQSAKAVGHFLFEAFVVVFGSDEVPARPIYYPPPWLVRVVKGLFLVLLEILIIVFGSDEETTHA